MELSPNMMIWIIAALSTGGVILQPFKLPEAIWAVGGAALLLALQLITPEEVLSGAIKGIDVYLFLIGMMLLAEIAREEALFDWLAAVATSRAKGSPGRLFLLIYGVGTLVTIFLERRHGGRPDARRCRGRQDRRGRKPSSLPAHLRLCCERGIVCFANLQPCQSGHLRTSYAAAARVVTCLFVSFDSVDRRDLRRITLDAT